MVIDKRKQKREIKIKLEVIGYDFSLDDFVDKVLVDLKTILEQRERVDKVKMIVEIK